MSEHSKTCGAKQGPIGGQHLSARGKSPEIVDDQQEDAEDDEDAASDGGNEGQEDKKKARAKSVLLNPEQEEDLIAWLKNHPELYDTHKNDFRKTTLKTELWEAKAQSMKLTYADIQQWYATQRTRFWKLLKPSLGRLPKP